MTLHKLDVDEFYDDSFSLLAIHCRLEDYRLAYLLNKHLGLQLKRKAQDLDHQNFTESYPIFQWQNENQDSIWNLVSNCCKKEEEVLQNPESLFVSQTKTIKTYSLLPELKNVDYLLKISNETQQFNEKLILEKIQSIPQIITTYSIDTKQIKLKDRLIFD